MVIDNKYVNYLINTNLCTKFKTSKRRVSWGAGEPANILCQKIIILSFYCCLLQYIYDKIFKEVRNDEITTLLTIKSAKCYAMERNGYLPNKMPHQKENEFIKYRRDVNKHYNVS